MKVSKIEKSLNRLVGVITLIAVVMVVSVMLLANYTAKLSVSPVAKITSVLGVSTTASSLDIQIINKNYQRLDSGQYSLSLTYQLTNHTNTDINFTAPINLFAFDSIGNKIYRSQYPTDSTTPATLVTAGATITQRIIFTGLDRSSLSSLKLIYQPNDSDDSILIDI